MIKSNRATPIILKKIRQDSSVIFYPRPVSDPTTKSNFEDIKTQINDLTSKMEAK